MLLVRNLLRRKTRTFLTLLGIAVGIAAIVSLVALSSGVVANYLEVTQRTGADITIQAVQSEGQALTLGTGFDEELVERLRALPEVKHASGMLYTMVRASDLPMFIIFGYEPAELGIKHFKVIEGVSLAEADPRARRGGKPMILGKTAADSLDKGLGDTVLLERTAFRVVGIYETGIALEDAGAVISLDNAQTLAEMPRQIMYLGLQLHNPEHAEQFKARLERILPPDVEVAGTQLGSMMLDMLEMLDVFAWGVALIAAVVGGVGMMNTMLMSVFERTQEIGVLRAVGWRRSRVLRMILGESLLLALIGGTLGLGLGAGLTWLAARASAMTGFTRSTVPPELVLQALVSALVLGAIGGVYPAWRAAKATPVEALSTEGGSSSRQGSVMRWGGMVLKNLWRQQTRSGLTVLGVSVGVIAMILVGSLGEGAIKSFNSMISEAEITAVEADQPDTSLSTIEERTLRRIEALPEVEYVSGVLFSVVSMPGGPPLMITARARHDPYFGEHILRRGHLIQGRRQCLLGWRAVSQLDKEIGDRVTMLGTTFTVVGVVETKSGLEDNGAIISLSEAQRLLKKPHQVMVMELKLKNPRSTEMVLERLSAQYPGLLFSKSAEFTENLPDMEMMNQSIGAIFVVAAFVGSIALMNTMIMSVYERTREIGILRAIGWRKGMVLRQILSESLLLTLTSGGASTLVSVVLVKMVRNLPSLGMYSEMLVVTPAVVLRSMAFCIGMGVLGGLYPAWRATTFSPVEALRYE
jgi:ABC-type antimicrobial peptide transport system permease subunit